MHVERRGAPVCFMLRYAVALICKHMPEGPMSPVIDPAADLRSPCVCRAWALSTLYSESQLSCSQLQAVDRQAEPSTRPFVERVLSHVLYTRDVGARRLAAGRARRSILPTDRALVWTASAAASPRTRPPAGAAHFGLASIHLQMAANPPLVEGPGGQLFPAPYAGEYIGLSRSHIDFDLRGVRTKGGRWSARGTAYLTNMVSPAGRRLCVHPDEDAGAVAG